MEEIQIFQDEALKEEVIDLVQFLPVMAGETSTKRIYIKNKVKYKLNLKLFLTGENISITQEIQELFPEEVKEIVFELKPTITTMKPISAELKIKLDYVVG